MKEKKKLTIGGIFSQIVLLILLSPFVLFMLGLVLSIVLLDDFLNDD